MPLYEYQCTECEATLEAIQAFSAPPLEDCPECGRPSLKKLLSAPAFQFKGSGWYATDSRSASERKKFKDDGKPPEKSDSKPVKTDGAKSNGSATDGGAKAGASAGVSDKASGSGDSSK